MANAVVSFFGAVANAIGKSAENLQPVSDRGNWFPIIRESFTGAWQRGVAQTRQSVLTFGAVYAVVTLIASDIGKIRLRLVEQDDDDIWSEVTVAAFSPVLRKPNRYQNRIKFIEQWIISKLLHGNTYVLLERDNRQVVVAMYILDPTKVKPLVAEDGSVYYKLSRDNLSGVEEDNTIVPASEIIHDVMVPLYHPLVGVSPLTACGAAAAHGMTIQRHSEKFFQNGSRPGGILSAPSKIDNDNAKRIKEHWEQNFSGDNSGRVAVLGDGLKYEAMGVNATDAQLIEQLKWDETNICTTFHVPPYMIGVGAAPTYNNIEALNQQYYTQCLQSLIESLELCLDEGLGLVYVPGVTYGTEFDLDDLLRMDTATKVKTYGDAVKAALFSPDEARKKFDLRPTPGGDTPYLQQQNFSLAALAKRDARDDPFAVSSAGSGSSAKSGAAANDNTASEEEVSAVKTVANWALRAKLLGGPMPQSLFHRRASLQKKSSVTAMPAY